MAKQIHNIDFGKLREFGGVGIRRAAIFVGLGMNAVHREDFLDYQLNKIPSATGGTRFPIEFFPSDLPPERVKEFKREFGRWIQDCCLCDLLEHHALLLDRMHLDALVAFKSLSKLTVKDDAEKLHNSFRHLGIPGKHKELGDRFGLVLPDSNAIDQLYEARNALTHDFGVVLPKRNDPDRTIVLTWPTFTIYGVGRESGVETPIADMMGVPTKEETDINLRIGSEQRTFKVGERIEIGLDELEAILLFFKTRAVPGALNSFASFLRGQGLMSADEPEPTSV